MLGNLSSFAGFPAMLASLEMSWPMRRRDVPHQLLVLAACLCRLGISILLPAPSCTPSGNSSGTHREETSLRSLNQRLRTGRLAHARAGTRRWFSAGCALATHTRRMAISFAVRNDPSVFAATSLLTVAHVLLTCQRYAEKRRRILWCIPPGLENIADVSPMRFPDRKFVTRSNIVARHRKTQRFLLWSI